MPKITTQRIHRLHISLFDIEYQKLKLIAEQNHTSVSYLIRRMIHQTVEKENEIKQKAIQALKDWGEEIETDEIKEYING